MLSSLASRASTQNDSVLICVKKSTTWWKTLTKKTSRQGADIEAQIYSKHSAPRSRMFGNNWNRIMVQFPSRSASFRDEDGRRRRQHTDIFLEVIPPSRWSPKAVTSGQLFSLWSIYSCSFLVGTSLHLFQFYDVSRSRVQTYLRSKFRLVTNFDRFGYQQKLWLSSGMWTSVIFIFFVLCVLSINSLLGFHLSTS